MDTIDSPRVPTVMKNISREYKNFNRLKIKRDIKINSDPSRESEYVATRAT